MSEAIRANIERFAATQRKHLVEMATLAGRMNRAILDPKAYPLGPVYSEADIPDPVPDELKEASDG